MKALNPIKLLSLSDDDFAKLIEAAKSCISMKSLAAYAGVKRNALWRWLCEGRKEQDARLNGATPNASLDRCVALVEALALGEAELERGALDVIRSAASAGVWQAGAWLLERRWPDEWADNRREMVKLLKENNELLRREIAKSGRQGDEDESEEEGGHEQDEE